MNKETVVSILNEEIPLTYVARGEYDCNLVRGIISKSQCDEIVISNLSVNGFVLRGLNLEGIKLTDLNEKERLFKEIILLKNNKPIGLIDFKF